MSWLAPALLVACSSMAFGTDGEVSIDDVRVEAGVVLVRLSLHLDKEYSVYDWRGHVYPLLGYGLHVEAVLQSGEKLQVENVRKVIPKLPQDRDVVRSLDHTYAEPLQLSIGRSDGRPLAGCADLTVRYDTTKMTILGPLDSVRLNPATIQVCFLE